MNLNELARECHQIARDKGFWDGIEPLDGEPTVEQWGMIWKQVCHLFSEYAEYEEATNVGTYWQEELADVAIVLLDLCAFLGVDLGGADYWHPISVWWATGDFASTLRKDGVDVDALSISAIYIIGNLLTILGDDLEGEIRKKMDKNRARLHRYGVHDG